MTQRTASVFTFVFLFISSFSIADEGMWLPKLIKDQQAKMQSMGMQITAEEIYSEEKSSLKDAIVHFGGGCTAEIISDMGLILTNHHCGYSRIQFHSSLENNYLKDGFWAESLESELSNPGLTASIYVSMKEVTDEIMNGVKSKMSNEEKAEIIEANIKAVGKAATEGTHYDYQVRPYYEGNQFYLILRETFRDVRLVGAPPSSIGKYGFDTDNWVWPRHTGDFSMFRIYANKDNKPAEYSEDNVPYKPKKSLPISIKGVKEGDFTMVYGFPGTTYEYLYSGKLDIIINKALPLAIEMRETSLSVINKAMRESEKVNIQYASKQSRISNAWKKWIGQTKGLERIGAMDIKKVTEDQFKIALSKDKKFQKAYGELFNQFDSELPEYEKYYVAYTLWREFVYYGPEFIRFVRGMDNIANGEDSVEAKQKALIKRVENFYKNYQPEIDKDILVKMSPLFFENMDQSLFSNSLSRIVLQDEGRDYSRIADNIFSKSIFTSEERAMGWAENYDGNNEELMKDPAVQFMEGVYNTYTENIQDQYQSAGKNVDAIEKSYMQALMTVLPGQKDYYPDANGTLRVSYGQVGGYYPTDAVKYFHQTTGEGILQKYVPGSYEYDVPEKLVTLIRNKDFGDYGDGDTLPVCFIASNHTSGGNSGSPALNANGELIGLNFDRTWESTMSDMMFDPSICRNIMVDLRYVLFIVDKFAGADRLIEEMEIVK